MRAQRRDSYDGLDGQEKRGAKRYGQGRKLVLVDQATGNAVPSGASDVPAGPAPRYPVCPARVTAPAEPTNQMLSNGVYIDRKGVKRRTGPSASNALSWAPGSPRSSLETNPAARIAAPSSPRFAACSRSASESLYRSRTMALGLIVAEVHLVLQRPGVLGPDDLHGLSGQALELLERARLVKLEPADALKLTHCSGLQSCLLSVVKRGPVRPRRDQADRLKDGEGRARRVDVGSAQDPEGLLMTGPEA